jgi:hypothetical protein
LDFVGTSEALGKPVGNDLKVGGGRRGKEGEGGGRRRKEEEGGGGREKGRKKELREGGKGGKGGFTTSSLG